MAEPAKRRTTVEGDAPRSRVHEFREEWMHREHGTFPDRGATVRLVLYGFCPCARCQRARTRIDGDN
jgi:hypothetical protein